jgi:hypothetical protein
VVGGIREKEWGRCGTGCIGVAGRKVRRSNRGGRRATEFFLSWFLGGGSDLAKGGKSRSRRIRRAIIIKG